MKLQVLVIEDNSLNQRMIAKHLETLVNEGSKLLTDAINIDAKIEIEIIIASNRHSAVEKYKNHFSTTPPFFIWLDENLDSSPSDGSTTPPIRISNDVTISPNENTCSATIAELRTNNYPGFANVPMIVFSSEHFLNQTNQDKDALRIAFGANADLRDKYFNFKQKEAHISDDDKEFLKKSNNPDFALGHDNIYILTPTKKLNLAETLTAFTKLGLLDKIVELANSNNVSTPTENLEINKSKPSFFASPIIPATPENPASNIPDPDGTKKNLT